MRRQDDLHCFVETGDTWNSIAAAAGVTKDALWKANGTTVYRNLVVGEMLHLPFD
jgi:spore germination protein YaaH